MGGGRGERGGRRKKEEEEEIRKKGGGGGRRRRRWLSWLHHAPGASASLLCFQKNILKELPKVAGSTFLPHLSESPMIFMQPSSLLWSHFSGPLSS